MIAELSPLCLENAEHRVEVLVNAPAFVERSALRVAHDTADAYAGEDARRLAHFGIDVVLVFLEAALRFAARHKRPDPWFTEKPLLLAPESGNTMAALSSIEPGIRHG